MQPVKTGLHLKIPQKEVFYLLIKRLACHGQADKEFLHTAGLLLHPKVGFPVYEKYYKIHFYITILSKKEKRKKKKEKREKEKKKKCI